MNSRKIQEILYSRDTNECKNNTRVIVFSKLQNIWYYDNKKSGVLVPNYVSVFNSDYGDTFSIFCNTDTMGSAELKKNQTENATLLRNI